MKTYWLVAVNAPIPQTLTYSSELELRLGSHVVVQLGKSNRNVSAVVIAQTEKPDYETKDILSKQEHPDLSETFLSWLQWVSEYYKHPIGQVMSLAFPGLSKDTKRLSKKKSIIPDIEKLPPPTLSEIQKAVVDNIPLDSFQPHLLFGVTGSGKTEVYMQCFDDCIQQGKQGLFLLPEISLTPQLIYRFAKRFGNELAVIHSQLTDRERTNQWWRIASGEAKILIGARSALFCPIPNLGLIVIDEEHEGSYKQEEKLKYHARDAAIVLAQKTNIPIILGSATPSLETWYNATTGKYKLHKLKERINNVSLPEIYILDLKQNKTDDLPFWMTPVLFEKISDRLEKGEQCALFLNRRGMAPSVVCNQCGAKKDCPNCAVTLTLHSKSHLHCHYCDYHENYKEECSECTVGEMIPLGLGTEKVEEDIGRLFPTARLARADRDEIDKRENMEDLIDDMMNNKIDILIGTQMIAKGLDFPNLSLVAIVLADVGFNIQDFRANERSFQLITQVSGRAGRHQIKGEVILQTYNVEHPVLKFVESASYELFAEQELEFRRELFYPPYSKLACLRLQGLNKAAVINLAEQIRQFLERLVASNPTFEEVRILGPSEAPLSKLRGKFRYQILLKASHASHLSYLIQQLQNQTALQSPGTKVLIDIDPVQMG
ncbi:MAG: primosomal protein N' [Bdellovibrionales bacterium]|nr:primosomal protein N' [Bdellovibrionales bacterium]